MKDGDYFYLLSVEVVNKEDGNLIKRLEFCDSVETAVEATKKYEKHLKKSEDIWIVPYMVGQSKADPPMFGGTYFEYFLRPNKSRYSKAYISSIKRDLRYCTPEKRYSRYWPVGKRMKNPEGVKSNDLSSYVFASELGVITRHEKKNLEELNDLKIVSPSKAVCPRCWNNVEHCDCEVFPTSFMEVDEMIQPAIIKLNRKGYYTAACCEGHDWRNDEAYVLFKVYYKFPIELPELWYSEGKVIRLNYKSALQGNENFEDVKKRKIKEFIEWVDRLPERKESFSDEPTLNNEMNEFVTFLR